MLVVDGLHATAAGGVVFGGRDLHLSAVGQVAGGLHQSLAIGTGTDNHRPVQVLQRSGQDFRGRGRRAVHQYGQRDVQVDGLAQGLVGEIGLRDFSPRGNQRLAARQEVVGNVHRLVQQTAAVVAQVDDERGDALLLQVEEGLLELACRLAGEGAEVDVAHVVLQLRIIRYDGQLDGTAHQFEVERFLHARTLHRQLEAGARLSAEHLADLLVVLPGQVLSVNGHQDVARLQSGLGSRHAFVGLADHGALQLRVPGDDGTDAAIRVLEHLLQLALVVLGVIGRIGVERVEHGIDALADGLVGIDGIDIEHVQLLHNRAEDVDVLGQPEAAVVTVLEAHECRAGHHQQQQGYPTYFTQSFHICICHSIFMVYNFSISSLTCFQRAADSSVPTTRMTAAERMDAMRAHFSSEQPDTSPYRNPAAK